MTAYPGLVQGGESEFALFVQPPRFGRQRGPPRFDAI